MAKKLSLAAGLLVLLIAAAAGVMYITNSTPAVPGGVLKGDRPIVVKFHARWCPLCMLTKDAWQTLNDAYRDRVDLVVFDFTNDQTTEASRADARRQGLEPLFNEYFGTTGSVFVLNGRSKAVSTELHGNRNFDDYRTAIDAALREP